MFSKMVSSSFVHCQHPHLYHLQDSDAAPRPEGVHPPVFSALRQSRVVSSTSEEEEALTEKFLKINCKYITDGKVIYSIKYRPIDDYRHIVHSVFSPSCHIQITTNCCWLKNELSSTTNCQIWPMEERRQGCIAFRESNHINLQQSYQLQVVGTLGTKHISKEMTVNVELLEK